MPNEDLHIPIIDVTSLIDHGRNKERTAAEFNAACRTAGFFYITGHGIDPDLIEQLIQLSRKFFLQPIDNKKRIDMERAGRAWRGYFSVGQELTSGKPDQKEGVYFGQELPTNHPLVVSGTPLHGSNLFPDEPVGLREVVLDYMTALTGLGHRLMEGIALALGLNQSYFEQNGVAEPLTLFRIFHYPPTESDQLWGVGEHTDYGLLTILLQDDVGGLEVKTPRGWIAAPPVPGTFVCNIGDMLDRMTRGVYRSTPHRVRNHSQRMRLSFPFFYDPNFFAQVKAIELPTGEANSDDCPARWDQSSVHDFRGTYGDYLLSKVGKVFPELKTQVL
ncbi:MAG: 2-oxoglutarate and iron-dependent oxygenase domain-containing protein [Pirellulales bacterium]